MTTGNRPSDEWRRRHASGPIYAPHYQPTKINETIERLRTAHRLNRLELATRIGSTWESVRGWENGRTMPGAIYLCALATVFDITVDELLTGKIEEPHE